MKLLTLLFVVSSLFTHSDISYIEQVKTKGELGADLQDIAFGNGMYVAIEREGSGEPPKIFTSDDARNWSVSHELEQATLQGIKYINGTFYIFGKWRDIDDMNMPYYSNIWTSATGLGWAEAFSEIIEGSPQVGVTDITYGDGKFIASINEKLFVSTEGVSSFSQVTDTEQFGLQRVEYGNGIFVGLNTMARTGAINMAYSTDGVVWTTQTTEPTADCIAFINDHFVTLSSFGMRISYDGIDWQEISQGRGTSIAYAQGTYMFPEIMTHAHIRYSTDLEKNISKIYKKDFEVSGSVYSNIRGIAAGENGFVMAGAVGILYAPYEHIENYPKILGEDIIELESNQSFEYTVHTHGFNPDRLRTNLEVGVDLPPGITRRITNWSVPLDEESPHFIGTPTESGDWPIILYAYEDGLGEMELYVKKLVTFRVNEATSVKEEADIINEFYINNFPNPFNPSTQITFSIPAQAHVHLEVYNLLGERIAVLLDEQKSPGRYEVLFDAAGLSSGVYFYRIRAGDGVQTRHMTLAK